MKNEFVGAYVIGVFAFLAQLGGCAEAPKQKQFEAATTKNWNLEDAPILSGIISKPIDSIVEISEKIVEENKEKKRRGKFESDEEFKVRIAALPATRNVFFVVPLKTGDCTKYDFATKIYSISCRGFRLADALENSSKITGKSTLGNAYTTRDVEYIQLRKYHVNLSIDGIGNLHISSEEAKAIDTDLLFGILASVKDATLEESGCTKNDVDFRADYSTCRASAFKVGTAVEELKYIVITDAILESVIYTKSSNKVLQHRIYGSVQAKQ